MARGGNGRTTRPYWVWPCGGWTSVRVSTTSCYACGKAPTAKVAHWLSADDRSPPTADRGVRKPGERTLGDWTAGAVEAAAGPATSSAASRARSSASSSRSAALTPPPHRANPARHHEATSVAASMTRAWAARVTASRPDSACQADLVRKLVSSRPVASQPNAHHRLGRPLAASSGPSRIVGRMPVAALAETCR